MCRFPIQKVDAKYEWGGAPSCKSCQRKDFDRKGQDASSFRRSLLYWLARLVVGCCPTSSVSDRTYIDGMIVLAGPIHNRCPRRCHLLKANEQSSKSNPRRQHIFFVFSFGCLCTGSRRKFVKGTNSPTPLTIFSSPRRLPRSLHEISMDGPRNSCSNPWCYHQ